MPDDPERLRDLLARTAAHATAFYAGLPDRAVRAEVDVDTLRTTLGGPLPDGPSDPNQVLDRLVAAADPGIVATAGPRFHGFVIGGSLPAALAAEWMTVTWDQNAGLVVASPAAAVAEEVAGAWLLDLLRLPPTASCAFVSGAQMANFVGLAAARHHVLDHIGWDVEADGLFGAPPVHVVVGQRRHATIDTALRMLGFGAARTTVVPVDPAGRMRPGDLADSIAGEQGPLIVCAQAGEINTGAFDPFPEICARVHDVDGWVHVDGAFGLWAGASPRLQHLVAGVEEADSWSTDGHKWLNVPYDSGFAFTAHPASHRAAFASQASYLIQAEAGGPREPGDFVPELSRRARGFSVWAALQSLGRSGVAELVERCCDHAQRFATALAKAKGVRILNEIELNQVLVRFGDSDDHTRAVIERVQQDGTCWLGGTEWHGEAAMRISVSNWSTTAADVDRSVDAILRAHAAA